MFDVQHLTTLLGFLAAVADQRSRDAELAGWLRRWETRLLRSRPTRAPPRSPRAERPRPRDRPYDGSKLGRAGHGSWSSSARSARHTTPAPARQAASSSPQPEVDLLEFRRRGHQLPAAGRQRVHLAVLAQEHEVPVARGGERCRRSAASRRSRRGARSPGGRAVAHAAIEQLADDGRLGDVLDAVDVRLGRGLRRADVPPARPLADRVPGDAGELPGLTGEEVPMRFRRGATDESYPRLGLPWQARAGIVRRGSVAPAAVVRSAAGDLDVPQAHMPDDDGVAVAAARTRPRARR